MITAKKYILSSAIAACNDASADTWEVRALDTNGRFWTVSDSATMTEQSALALAESMRCTTDVVEYSLDSLGDIAPAAFETACRSRAASLGYEVEFLVGLNNRETIDGEPSDMIVERAFAECCDAPVFSGIHYRITFVGGFILIHPVSANEVFDTFDELVESYPFCEESRAFFFGECCDAPITNRQDAINLLTSTILGEDIGIGSYRDSAAYKLCNGDISAKTSGLSDDVINAIAVVGSLTWEEIGR